MLIVESKGEVAKQVEKTKMKGKTMAETGSLKKGFSLIEIMIVIMIIGVLAAAAFGGLRWLQQAKISTTNSKLAAMDTMLEQYNTQIGTYPTDTRELIEGPSSDALRKKWGEAIAAEADLNDAWNQPFVYQVAPKGSRPPYTLYSIGSKGDAQIRSPRSQE